MSDPGASRQLFGRTPGEWLWKAATFACTIFLLSWFYAWASPWAYPKDRPLGFGYGTLHGALMPMALPSLVTGRDVDIFATNHAGRPYKIGYIVGINLCGLLVFGSMFWAPAKRRN